MYEDREFENEWAKHSVQEAENIINSKKPTERNKEGGINNNKREKLIQ